jgi:ketosteroid isomerase-like protein
LSGSSEFWRAHATAIAKLADDVAHAVDAGDLNRNVDFYGPAAISLAVSEPVINRNVGKAIANRWRTSVGSNRAHMAIRVEEVNVSGDLAYDRISYTVTIMLRIVNLVPAAAHRTRPRDLPQRARHHRDARFR